MRAQRGAQGRGEGCGGDAAVIELGSGIRDGSQLPVETADVVFTVGAAGLGAAGPATVASAQGTMIADDADGHARWVDARLVPVYRYLRASEGAPATSLGASAPSFRGVRSSFLFDFDMARCEGAPCARQPEAFGQGGGASAFGGGSIAFGSGGASVRLDGARSVALSLGTDYSVDSGGEPPSFCASAWFRTSQRSRVGVLLSQSDAGFQLEVSNNVLLGRAGAGQPPLRGSTRVADGAWHHAALCHDGDWAGVFLDGVAEAETLAWGRHAYRGAAELSVGAVNGGAAEAFVGEVDYVQLLAFDRGAVSALPAPLWAAIASLFPTPPQVSAAPR